MHEKPLKILILRFSSFGDVLQTLSVIRALKTKWPESEIHWVTRREFVPLIENHPDLKKAWGLDKNQGFQGLLALAKKLDTESFTRIYDAHNNLRSLFLCLYFFFGNLFKGKFPPVILRRSLKRWRRFFLFQLRINFFEQPFSGQRDLLEPLQRWGIPKLPPPAPQLFLPKAALDKALHRSAHLGTFVALAPSAAFPLKRWPLEHWRQLIQIWISQDPSIQFVLLGGPEDSFLEGLVALAPTQIHNFAGQLSMLESAAMVQHSQLLITNDTGLLHVGEQLGHPTIALMGPAPFGFPCRRQTTTILELDLPCRPCSKHGQGPCRNPRFQWCLVGIGPERVYQVAQAKRLGRMENPQ